MERELFKIDKRGSVIIVGIADLHFGVIDPKTQYDILYEQFIKEIDKLPIIDVITILGDIFDRRVMSDSDAAMYSSLFIHEVREVAIKKNATVVIIMGTRQHDADQLKLFYHYLNDPEFDIRIIENIKFENIKGMRVLCIPELYGVDENIYQNFFCNAEGYDICFAHCAFEGAIYSSGSARMFNMDDFKLCRGPILSGHVHVPGCHAKDFYYSGSPLRWRFGEEQEKGFMIVLYDLDSRMYLPYLIPIHSFKYTTINIDHILDSEPEQIIKYIDELKIQGIDHLRLEITDPISTEKMNILKEYYVTNKSIHFLKKDNLIEKETQQKDIDEFEEYKYLFDKTLSSYDKLAIYINSRQNDMIFSGDSIKQVLLEGGM